MPRDWWDQLRAKEPPFTPQEKLLLGVLIGESLLLFLLVAGAFRVLG